MASKAAAAQAAKNDDVASYVLEHQVGHLLRRAHQRHTTIFQDGMGDVQLTPTQYAALVKIRDLGQISQNQLGRLTAMDPATIQGVVQRLAGRGLVFASRDPMDRRVVVLELTPEGCVVLEQARAAAARTNEALLAPLSAPERAQLLLLLRRLLG